MQNKIDMSKVAPYVARETIKERLMGHPMAQGFRDMPDEDQEVYLNQIMDRQFTDAAHRVVTFVANLLYLDVLAIPLKVRLMYNTCRIPMIPLAPLQAHNLRDFVK